MVDLLIRCHIDVETYSEVNLKDCGVYVYAEHESTELLVLCYRFGDGPVTAWLPFDKIPFALHEKLRARLKPEDRIKIGAIVPAELRAHIEAGGEVAAHNAQFERVVLNGVAGRKVNFPKLKIEQMVCTAAKARTYGLPGALGDAAKALKSYPKDETGRGIMLQLCRPRTGKQKRYPIEEYIDDYVHLYAYCVDDVKAECGLDDVIPDITPDEMEIWRLDQVMNDRGVGIDLAFIDNVQALIQEYKVYLNEQCVAACGFTPGQREKIVGWIRSNGYSQIVDMTADTVAKAVVDPACPEHVRHVLRIYSTYGMKAPTKYEAMELAACRNSRIHGMFIYYGAGTGRWSSIIVQLQNLFRPLIKDADTAIDLINQKDMETIRFFYPSIDPMKVFASCVRGALVPADGHDFIVLDYAGIESRKIAWLYDEEWKLDAFRAFDADKKNNADNYQIAYGNGFGVDPMSIKDFQRQIGKVMELALGFEGGVGSFVTMAPTYRVDLNDLVEAAYDNLPDWALDAANWMWKNIECKRGNKSGLPEKTYLTIDGIKQVWRSLHPAIKQGWKDTLQAAKLAVAYPGKCYAIPNRKIMFQVKEEKGRRWLHMRLPSGRTLKYYEPELHDGRSKEDIAAEEEEKFLCELMGKVYIPNDTDPLKKYNLVFWGVDSRTKQWKLEGAYGGFLAQNGTQGSANDVLRHGIVRLEAARYPVVLTVHDENGMEVLEGFGSLHEAAALMCKLKPCFAGLPITAEGYRAKRFRKQ